MASWRGDRQARNQLGTPRGAKSFLRAAQFFYTMCNRFELCPKYFSRGASSPLVTGLEFATYTANRDNLFSPTYIVNIASLFSQVFFYFTSCFSSFRCIPSPCPDLVLLPGRGVKSVNTIKLGPWFHKPSPGPRVDPTESVNLRL